MVQISTILGRLLRVVDIDDQVEACRRIFASDTLWTVVRGSDLIRVRLTRRAVALRVEIDLDEARLTALIDARVERNNYALRDMIDERRGGR